MKFAVIAGVIHMSLGIVMKGANTIHFWDITDFLFEFIPQFLFFICIFGYMCFAIIIKWLTDWRALGISKPPEIIGLMINFVSKVDTPLWGDAEQQLYIQRVLAITAISTIPIMLIVKPLIIYLKQQKTIDEPNIVKRQNMLEKKNTSPQTTMLQ